MTRLTAPPRQSLLWTVVTKVITVAGVLYALAFAYHVLDVLTRGW